jgi:ABC-2 type transport system ATP-binding protein
MIQVKNLTKIFRRTKKGKNLLDRLIKSILPEYEEIKALNNVSFEIKKGEFVGILGPNGSGKTTLSRILCGILKPDKGEVKIFGLDPFYNREKVVRKMGIMFGHKLPLAFNLRSYDAVRIYSMYFDVSEEDFEKRFWKYAKILNVEHLVEARIRELSLGERQKFCLLAILMHDPEILILDEPTLGIDIPSKVKIRELIRKINKTVLFTSHDALDIETVCKRIIILRKGEIIFDGKIEELKQKITKRIVKIQTENPVKKKVPLKKVSEYFFEGVINKEDIENIIETFKPYGIADLEIKYPSTEEILMEIFR